MSSTHIDYRIRPAKHIERQMLCELFRCLSPFGQIESYRYWGFGALYFADFLLMHKALGIANMLSMERDATQEARHIFNRPYKCIALDFRSSQEVLASVEHWDARTIAWLDYTDKLDSKIMADIQCFIAHSHPGSVLMVTVNAQADRLPHSGQDTGCEVEDATPLDLLKERVGPDNVPQDVTAKDLAGWGTAAVEARLMRNIIADTLHIRNGTRAAGTRYKYQQLVHFRYDDGARMLTLGGVIFQEGQELLVSQCGFEKLSFFRAAEEFYKIDIPFLTAREKRYLDAELPLMEGETLTSDTGIPQEVIEKYQRVYRYFPTFIVGE
jgi:hypothetical protein